MNSMLLNIGLFFTQNNLRRNVATFSANYGSTGSESSHTFLAPTDGSYHSWVTPMSVSTATVLKTSAPVSVILTRRDDTTVTFTVTKLLIVDFDVKSLQVKASTAEVPKVSLFQV